jgi:protein SCO1/2
MRASRPTVIAAALLTLALAVAAGAAHWALRLTRAIPSGVELERLDDHGRVPAFTLVERSGRRVTREDLRGLVWVADFIYTDCTETCPTQSLQFGRLQSEFAGASDLRLVSITVDPTHDTPEVLRRYAERYGATDRWWFLTGDKREIYCLAQRGFRLSVVDPAGPAEPECGQAFRLGPAAAWASHGSGGLVMHSARFVLVDRRRHIRAYHRPTDRQSLETLAANVRTLLAERAQAARGGSR